VQSKIVLQAIPTERIDFHAFRKTGDLQLHGIEPQHSDRREHHAAVDGLERHLAYDQ
jgi:hypothetical protein